MKTKLITDLQLVETELVTLAPRLTERFRNNIEAAAALQREAIATVTRLTTAKAITLLTFDPEAGMAYLYLVPPGDSAGRVERTVPGALYCDGFAASLDRGADHRALGAEFPASSPEEALARAAEVHGAIA